jgi:hypothetical protein
MTRENWIEKLGSLAHRYPIKIRSGLDDLTLLEAERAIGNLPDDIKSFYQATNGLRYEWLNLFPIEMQNDIADTWDGLRRANDKEKTKFLSGDESLLSQFLVIAEIGGGYCACVDRKDGSIWIEDREGMHQTTLTLLEFIETTVREVSEL